MVEDLIDDVGLWLIYILNHYQVKLFILYSALQWSSVYACWYNALNVVNSLNKKCPSYPSTGNNENVYNS